jgi:hypothetical protein
MKRQSIFTLVTLFVYLSTFAQNKDEAIVIEEYKNKYLIPIDFKQGLIGVKGAVIPQGTQDLVDFISRNPNQASSLMFNSFISYLDEELKLSPIAWTPTQLNQLTSQEFDRCDYVYVGFENGDFKSILAAIGEIPINIIFQFCDGQSFRIESTMSVSGNTNYSTKVKRHLSKILKNDWEYDKSYKRKSKNISLKYSSSQVDSLQNLPTKPTIEGSYSIFTKEGIWTVEEFLVVRSGEQFDIVYLKGNTQDWQKGELKGTLTPTLSEGNYLVNFRTINNEEISGSAVFQNNSIDLVLNQFKAKFIKVKQYAREQMATKFEIN